MRDVWIWFEIEPANTVTWDNTKLDEDRLREQGESIADPFTYGVPDDLSAVAPDSE